MNTMVSHLNEDATLHCLRAGSRGLRFPIQEFLMRVSDALAGWHDRAAERRRLLALDDRALRDIGIDRATAHIEGGKPFWRR